MLVFIPPIQSVHIIYALLTATQCVQTLKVAKSCVLAPKILIKETWRVPFALYKEGHDVFNHHSLTRCVKKEKCQLLKFKNWIGLNICRIRRKRERERIGLNIHTICKCLCPAIYYYSLALKSKRWRNLKNKTKAMYLLMAFFHDCRPLYTERSLSCRFPL